MMRILRRSREGSPAPRILTAAALLLLILALLSPAGAGTLRGRLVTGLPGEMPPGLTVTVTHLTAGISRQVALEADGSFEVPDLPEGLVAILVGRVGEGDGLPLAARAVRMPARGDVEVTLAPEARSAVPMGTFNFLLYKQEYYNNKTSEGAADPVTVTGTATTPNVNIAMATGGGTISGKVTVEGTSTPLPGMIVVAISSSSFLISFDRTLANGTYQITGVPADSFWVCVNTIFADETSDYVGEYYSDAQSILTAARVQVTEGQDTPNINFGLALGGRISGRITAQSGGAGLASADVSVASRNEILINFSTQADASGNYEFRALPPRTDYVVSAEGDGNYLERYYNNKATEETADQVSVTSGGTTSNINIALPPGGIIQGTVRDQATNNPLPDIYVEAASTGDYFERGTYTEADGSYSLEGLPTGSYTVSVYQMGLWYNNRTSEEEADPVSVTAGGAAVTGINFTGTVGAACPADPGDVGTISGRVTRVGGAAVQDAEITIYMSFMGFRYQIGYASTDAAGDYSLTCLNPGDYVLEAEAPYTNLIPEYYNNADSAGAQVLTVTGGGTLSSINFELAEGGGISGTITAEGGAPLGGVVVNARNTSTGAVASTYSLSNGTYQLAQSSSGGLRPGTYKVWVENHTTANLAYMPVLLARFVATPVEGGIAVEWATAEETNHAGFHVYRADAATAEPVRLTEQLLTGGPEYRFVDGGAGTDRAWWYWLGAVDRQGREERFGPVSAQAGAAPVPVSRLFGTTPNPFRAEAAVRFSLAQAGPVKLRVFDSSGRLVRTLIEGPWPEGPASVTWNGRDDAGRPATGGVYYISLVTREGMMTGKVVLAR